MKYLRVIDQDGNSIDYEPDFVPRIGERLERNFSRGGAPVRPHFYRVKDVVYRLGNTDGHQVAILVEEEPDGQPWPE